MCPTHRQPEATPTDSEAELNTSGCYPVVEKAREGLGPEQDYTSRTAPFEVRLVVDYQERCPVYEIRTEDSVYEFDQSLCCVAVRDMCSGEAKVRHQSLGTKLIGGWHLDNQAVDMSYPLPAVGHRALLGGDEHEVTVTTPVTRVIMNLQRWSCNSMPHHVELRNSKAVRN
jgi:hypothetical protein